MDREREVAELIDEVSQVVRAAVDQIRDGSIAPSPAQWARAQALREARAWVEFVVSASADEGQEVGGAEAQRVVEAVALRWAGLIETGSAE